jgi:choline dehydrogenase-like flavoprotein
MGLRRARVDWKISENERRTARELAKYVAEELARLGYGHAHPELWLDSEEPLSESQLRGTYHFIGATRMANSPENGVVNSDCRVFGLENLYLGGCSVFPTGGHANPTLTIVALAIRLADHLRESLTRKSNGASEKGELVKSSEPTA